jgi:ribulose-5-phosphate 4-epimerase/fuculose-1-phosphate aldolase
MSPAEARLHEVPSEMTDAEWNQRVNLAACYRLVAHYGWDDLVDTHISARVPGPEHHFLINPYGLMFDEITASSLVKVDLDGNQLTKSQYSINPAGFTIHSAIHEVREDAGCVLHLHTPDGTAVASCMEGLLPMNQTAQLVTHDLAYHDYEGIALDHDERPRLQKDLGTKNHMLLRNHGTLTVGRSVASAFERMFHLERACTMQVRTRMLGPTAYPVDPAVIDKNTSVIANPDRAELRSAAAQTRPARSQLQGLKFPEISLVSLPTTSALPYQNAAQFRAAFSFCASHWFRLVGFYVFGASANAARIRAHERMPL